MQKQAGQAERFPLCKHTLGTCKTGRTQTQTKGCFAITRTHFLHAMQRMGMVFWAPASSRNTRNPFFPSAYTARTCLHMRLSDAMDRGALQDGGRSAPNLLEIWARGHSFVSLSPSPCLSHVCHAECTLSYLQLQSPFHLNLTGSDIEGNTNCLCLCGRHPTPCLAMLAWHPY